MALNIKNDRAIQLAKQVAQITGETMTGAIIESLEQRLRLLARDGEREARLARIDELTKHMAKEFAGIDLHADVEALYDENGLPA